MGNANGMQGLGGPPGGRNIEEERKRQREKRKEEEKRREAGPLRVGKKRKKGDLDNTMLPKVYPTKKCRLRQLRLN